MTLARRRAALVPILLLLAARCAAAATVVVAPLHDASPNPDPDTVRGVTDLLAASLADKVAVIAHDKLDAVLTEQKLTAQGLADPKTAVRVGELLKADYVLTGSVFRQGDEVVFAVQLVKIANGEVVKGITAGGKPDKLLDTASQLADRCAEALQLKTPSAAEKLAPASHLAAERYFLEALGSYHAANYDRAAMNCLKVIQLDPNHEKARLRLAESFAAAGEIDQARIVLHRTLQLFPDIPVDPRLIALMDAVDPLPIQAAENATVSVALPTDWPRQGDVLYELSWSGQPARRDSLKPADGAVPIPMPPARAPLDLDLKLSAAGKTALRKVRLWPALADLAPPTRKLVLVDPAGQIAPLLAKVEHKVYQSCNTLPEPDRRLIVAPAVAATLDAATAKKIAEFVKAGGEVVILGPAPEGTELLGIKSVAASWPATETWTPHAKALAFSYLPPSDWIAALDRKPKLTLLSGGRSSLSADNGRLSLVTFAADARLAWFAWPAGLDPADPRSARLAALAASDLLFESPAAPH